MGQNGHCCQADSDIMRRAHEKNLKKMGKVPIKDNRKVSANGKQTQRGLFAFDIDPLNSSIGFIKESYDEYGNGVNTGDYFGNMSIGEVRESTSWRYSVTKGKSPTKEDPNC